MLHETQTKKKRGRGRQPETDTKCLGSDMSLFEILTVLTIRSRTSQSDCTPVSSPLLPPNIDVHQG